MLLTLSSCGAAHHLKQAQKHINKAKALGADVKSDTTYIKRTVEFKGPKAAFDFGPMVLHRKDGIVNKYILKDTVVYKNKIKLITDTLTNTVYIECPDEKKDIEVPITVDTTIKAGYTKWKLFSSIFGGIIFGVVVGFILGKFIKI